MTVNAADAAEEERQRLASIFRDLANETQAARRDLPETRSRARAILELQERVWRDAVLIALGDHPEHPRPPVGDDGFDPRGFQYIGHARTSVKAGEKVGVWLNERGAIWALNNR